MKYSNRLHLNAAALAVLAALAASSATAADTVSTETVKVTAARVEQEIQEVPMSLSVVTGDEVKHANAKTIADLLADIPGVQVTSSGSQGLKRIKIRGENSFRTLIMVDGQKLSEQKSMDGTAILMDPANIERIEVIKGPASVLYGSDAIGGAINIITKKGGKDAFEADASVAWNGAGHGWSESLTLGGSANRFHYRLSGNYQSQEDLDTPEGRLPHTAFRQKSASAFFGYDITDNIQAGIQADYFDSHLRSGSLEYGEEDFYVDIPRWKREKVGAFVDAKNISDVLTHVRWDAYWQKSQKVMTNHVHQVSDTAGTYTRNSKTYTFDSSEVTMDSTADNRLTTIGTSLQADWQLSDTHYLITGYEFSQDKLKADTVSNVKTVLNNASMQTPGGTTNIGDMTLNPVTNRYNKGTQTTHALFAAMESQLPHDFVANYGMRYTYVTSKMTDADAMSEMNVSMMGMNINSGAYADGSAGETGTNHNDRVVFNAGLTWNGIEDLALRATWSQGFRAPLLQEKYLQNTMGGGTVYGNPNLKPEKSNNFELGARFNRGPVHVDATVFYSLADDYITQERVGGTDTSPISKYMNADKAKTLGFELAGSYTFADHYTPYATVTLMRRQLETDSYSTYNSATPALSARYGLRTSHEVFGGTLTTDTYARSQTATKSYSSSTEETSRLAGFTTFNFGAGYRFGKNGNYSVDAEFINIFNQLYQYYNGTYEAGRSFNVKLTAHY